MRIIILKTNEIETACDKQENDCQGINCKTCQFNKIGVDVNFLKDKIYTATRDFLLKSKYDVYDNSKFLSNLFISILLNEEADEQKIGSIIFKKIIH